MIVAAGRRDHRGAERVRRRLHRDLIVRDDARHAVRAEGVTLVISHATPIDTPGTTVTSGSTFEKIFGGGTYSELIWAVGIVVILQLVLSFTRWGIYTVAVGGNRLGASEAGISTRKMLIRNFTMCAVLAAFVGILEAVRANDDHSRPQRRERHPVPGDLGSGHRRHAADGRVGHGHRRVHRRAVPRRPPRRPHDQGRQRQLPLLLSRLAVLLAMTANTYVARVRTGSGRG